MPLRETPKCESGSRGRCQPRALDHLERCADLLEPSPVDIVDVAVRTTAEEQVGRLIEDETRIEILRLHRLRQTLLGTLPDGEYLAKDASDPPPVRSVRRQPLSGGFLALGKNSLRERVVGGSNPLAPTNLLWTLGNRRELSAVVRD
jgi:hypothetical protein